MAPQEVDVKQQEIILQDSLAAYGRALHFEDMTKAELGSMSVGMHMTSAFPVCAAQTAFVAHVQPAPSSVQPAMHCLEI